MLDLAAIAPEKPHLMSLAEYEALIASGALEEERVELLHGVIVDMSPQGNDHAYVIRTLTQRLLPVLLGRAEVSVQAPFLVADGSLPEPDLAVIAPGLTADERPSRAHLVIEVADSSLRKDRMVKGPLYASAGVPEYWIVDLAHHRVERYRDPGTDGYRTLTTHERDELLRLIAFPDVELTIAEFLP